MANAKTTSSAHTPGPWTIEDEGDEDEVRLELKGDSGSKPIAEIYDSYMTDEQHDSQEEYEEDLAEYEANARLIAAAPELLLACEDALMSLESPPDDQSDSIARLTNAIAKARGE